MKKDQVSLCVKKMIANLTLIILVSTLLACGDDSSNLKESDMVNNTQNGVSDIVDGAANGAGDVIDGASNGAEDVIDGAANGVNDVVNGVENAVDDVTDSTSSSKKRTN